MLQFLLRICHLISNILQDKQHQQLFEEKSDSYYFHLTTLILSLSLKTEKRGHEKKALFFVVKSCYCLLWEVKTERVKIISFCAALTQPSFQKGCRLKQVIYAQNVWYVGINRKKALYLHMSKPQKPVIAFLWEKVATLANKI